MKQSDNQSSNGRDRNQWPNMWGIITTPEFSKELSDIVLTWWVFKNHNGTTEDVKQWLKQKLQSETIGNSLPEVPEHKEKE